MLKLDLFAELIRLLEPYVRNREALERATPGTRILEDLRVNSARLIDIVLAIEDRYGINVEEEEEEGLACLGDLVALVERKAG